MTRYKVTGPHKQGFSEKKTAYFQKKWEAKEAKEAAEVRGMLGNVPKLAVGATNPMWSTERTLESAAKRVAPILAQRRAIKSRMVSVPTIGQYFIKKIDVEEDEPLISNPVDEPEENAKITP